MKGSVEKGHKWWFEVKIEIGAIKIGTQAGFHVRNAVVHLFLELRSKIWKISVLLLQKKFFFNWTPSSEAWMISFVVCLN